MSDQKPPLAADTLDGVVRTWNQEPGAYHTSEGSPWGWSKVWSGATDYRSLHGIQITAPSPAEARALGARIVELLRVHGFERPNMKAEAEK